MCHVCCLGDYPPEHASQLSDNPTPGVETGHKVAKDSPNREKILKSNLALEKPEKPVLQVTTVLQGAAHLFSKVIILSTLGSSV